MALGRLPPHGMLIGYSRCRESDHGCLLARFYAAVRTSRPRPIPSGPSQVKTKESQVNWESNIAPLTIRS